MISGFRIANPEQLKNSLNSLDVVFEFVFGDAGEVGEFFDGDELMWFFVQSDSDFIEQILPISLTFAGDDLYIFGIYDASLFEHD